VGVSILASAGMIGIILGFAAQRSIATLFAGLQIALTQPIRIDDAVIVEGEWGRVEEITLTYVVIKIWDLRRLVVPVTYFLEKPFQNWTRVSANLLGTVFLYVDYSVPVDEVRRELQAILKVSALWDGQVGGVQVTNSSERTLELRLLMSAADSSKIFDLRCEVREKVLAFLQQNHPGSLPRVRADLGGLGPGAAGRLVE
jgi:small-conductance mechanosensitive channel